MPLGDDVPLEHAALLGCAALTGVGAVLNAARPEPGFTALVIGAGGVGQFVVQGARIAGAARSSSSTRSRRGASRRCARRDARLRAGRTCARPCASSPQRASTTPSTRSARPRRRRSRSAGRGAAAPRSSSASRPPARSSTLDPLDFTNREKTLTGTIYGSEHPAVALPRLIELVRDGELELASLVGPSFPLERADDAFQASLAGEPGRVLVTP